MKLKTESLILGLASTIAISIIVSLGISSCDSLQEKIKAEDYIDTTAVVIDTLISVNDTVFVKDSIK